jgi:molybdopterin-containing oxidoreductase family membrane subunit
MSAPANAIPIGITRSRGFYRGAVLALGVVFVVSAAVALATLTGDPGKGAWGVFMASAIYMLGLSQLGIVWAAIMRICNTRWARPMYRLGEVMTMASLPFAFAGLVLVYVYGRDDLLYWIGEQEVFHRSAWLDERVLLWRHLLSQVIFYGIAVTYFYMSLLPDVSPEAAQEGPAWRRRLYGWLLVRRGRHDVAALEEKVYRYAPVVILAYALPNTIIGWDFGMMLWPFYHSTVFTMYFMQGSLFGGTALLLLLYALLACLVDLRGWFEPGVQLKNTGIMLTGFAMLWLYLFWAQFFVSWYGNLPHEYGPLWAQMTGRYAPFFWAQILCIIAIPIGSMIFAIVKRTLWAMLLIATAMNVGVWINRYLMVVPALTKEHHLFAAPVEVALVLAPITGFLFVLLLLFSAIPMVSSWEMRAVTSAGHATHPA